MKKIILLTLSLVTLFLSSCEKYPGDDDMMGTYLGKESSDVACQRGYGFIGECEGYFYYIRYSEDEFWAPLYSEIKEFDYEEGYEYHITVRVYEQPLGIMDVGQYQYKLHKINSKVLMDSEVSTILSF